MRFEDVAFGEDLPELAPDVSAETVQGFARAAGMLHPRFFDDEAARREARRGAAGADARLDEVVQHAEELDLDRAGDRVAGRGMRADPEHRPLARHDL